MTREVGNQSYKLIGAASWLGWNYDFGDVPCMRENISGVFARTIPDVLDWIKKTTENT